MMKDWGCNGRLFEEILLAKTAKKELAVMAGLGEIILSGPNCYLRVLCIGLLSEVS